MITTFEKLQSKQMKNASVVSKRASKNMWQDRRNSFAYYVAGKPTLESGTIARDVVNYLSRRKNPVILKSIVRDIMDRRTYKNYDSARRTVGRVVAQLSNWGYITSGKSNEDLVTFQLNRSNLPKMPKNK